MRGSATSSDIPVRDDGYTMLEVVVAMAVFTVLAGSVFTVLTGALRTTGDNNRRTVAADLASAQVEQARSQRTVDIVDGLSSRTQRVGGTVYSVAQTASYVTADSSSSVCTGSGDALAYKLVTVEVTWPAMGTTQPVTASTLRALGIGRDGLDTATGTVAVKVQGANANPTRGSVVSLSPGGQTRTTGTDGCAVFTGLAPGTYTATTDQPGRVTSTGYQAMSTPGLSVESGRVARGSLYQDVERSQRFVLAPPAGYAVPAGVPVVFRDSYVSDTTAPACGGSPVRTCATGVPGELQHVFPDTYALWAGTCSDAAGTSPASFDATALGGSGTTATIPLGGVTASATTPGTALYAVHDRESGGGVGTACQGGETYALGTSSGAPLKSALPLGTWRITADPTSPRTTDPVVTLTSSARVATPVVVAP
ncbi:prepilin-type N-terminal cleavage/methylation domain-containing protein [Streptomyces sp. NP160]|uniref:type IV pilus modification PilV family protein n=1 Tax=Streptomyces sp. NP160 TaxID=2586637 RepID=UPI00111BC50F|nr:prepilin-type N-terminal cleavage/methylation domain-containing protein [Streptomyces sp. NP160]TNM64495.1 prepilin-type N-terminal cleavage/methylation domain-containing protein [Streptomyces sp. NP160]